jgi:8-oxo-dGTP diphosphatase
MNRSTVSAVGVWFYSQSTDRYLYLMRNDIKHPDTWGLPGGRIEEGENLLSAMYRECQEELGKMPDYTRLIPIEQFTTDDGVFSYHTFFCVVAEEFIPELNHEHFGYAWLDTSIVPRPLHKGLWSTINFDAVRNKIQTIKVQMSQ